MADGWTTINADKVKPGMKIKVGPLTFDVTEVRTMRHGNYPVFFAVIYIRNDNHVHPQDRLIVHKYTKQKVSL